MRERKTKPKVEDVPILETVAEIDLEKLERDDPEFYASLMPRRDFDPETAPPEQTPS